MKRIKYVLILNLTHCSVVKRFYWHTKESKFNPTFYQGIKQEETFGNVSLTLNTANTKAPNWA